MAHKLNDTIQLYTLCSRHKIYVYAVCTCEKVSDIMRRRHLSLKRTHPKAMKNKMRYKNHICDTPHTAHHMHDIFSVPSIWNDTPCVAFFWSSGSVYRILVICLFISFYVIWHAQAHAHWLRKSQSKIKQYMCLLFTVQSGVPLQRMPLFIDASSALLLLLLLFLLLPLVWCMCPVFESLSRSPL